MKNAADDQICSDRLQKTASIGVIVSDVGAIDPVSSLYASFVIFIASFCNIFVLKAGACSGLGATLTPMAAIDTLTAMLVLVVLPQGL